MNNYQMSWMSNSDTIIFAPEFNCKLDLKLVSSYKKIIFSNYKLNDDIIEKYTNNDFYDFIHPWSDDLPYTYDTWGFDYCADQGFSFTATSSSTGLPSNNIPGNIPINNVPNNNNNK